MSNTIEYNNVGQIQWTIGATLLNADGNESLGFAGAISGVSNDAFIFAGGANFPNGMPWEGGKKYYSDQIRLLEKTDDGYAWNENVIATLPEPIAYCGSTSTDDGIVYIGGENEDGISDKTFLLIWNPSNKQLEIKKLPNLPLALVNAGVAQIDNAVYVIGGDSTERSSNQLFRLDLKKSNLYWEVLADLPVSLANTVAVAQNSPEGMQVYVFGGRTKTASGISTLHHTTFSYHPLKNTWTECAAISNGTDIINLSAGAGLALGEDCVILAGGDDGIVFNQIETSLAKIAKANTAEEKQALTEAKNELLLNHSGFYKGTLIYNTWENCWYKVGELPYAAQVTTTAVRWDNNIILASGEIKPGERTPDIIIGKIIANEYIKSSYQ